MADLFYESISDELEISSDESLSSNEEESFSSISTKLAATTMLFYALTRSIINS